MSTAERRRPSRKELLVLEISIYQNWLSKSSMLSPTVSAHCYLKIEIVSAEKIAAVTFVLFGAFVPLGAHPERQLGHAILGTESERLGSKHWGSRRRLRNL